MTLFKGAGTLFRIARNPKAEVITPSLSVVPEGQSQLGQATECPAATANGVVVAALRAQWIDHKLCIGGGDGVTVVYPFGNITTHIVQSAMIRGKLPTGAETTNWSV